MLQSIQKNEEILQFCSINNSPAFNLFKANEECIEFQEVLLKLETKAPENEKRPNVSDAIDEFGDVIYRGIIKLKELFPNVATEVLIASIDERINYKLGKLIEYRNQGKYKGGL